MKYVILDEIALEILTDNNGEKKLFDTDGEAKQYARRESTINAWQVIEIAWHTEDK